MNTRQMEVFVNIVRYGNFSNAAKKMFLSQPAVSANIDLLEKELGAKLLIRQGRKTALTEKGRSFYDSCQTILGLTEQAVRDIQEAGPLTGTIRTIASFVPGLYLLPGYMKAFYEGHPGIHFEAVIRNSKDAFEGILDNFYDIGFVGSPAKSDAVLQKHIFQDSMVLVTPNTAPYNEMPKVLPALALKELPFVMRTWGSSTLSIAEQELKKKGVELSDLNVVAEFDSGEAITQAIKLNMGVSILSTVCVKDDPGLLTFEIEDVSMNRDFYAIILNSEYLAPRVHSFFAFLPDLDAE